MPLSVRLDPDLEARLAREAEQLGMSKSAFVKEVLERALGVRNPAELLRAVRSNTPMGRVDASENTGARFKAGLRAQHSD